jgi:hypothetical protein
LRAIEPIYAALFALGYAAASTATPITSASRRWIAWDQMTAEQSPAFFQREPSFAISGGVRGLPKFEFKAEWYLYLTTDPGDLTTVTSTPLNNYATALVNAIMPSIQGTKQTLGGLVENAYIDGRVIVDEGLVSSPAVLFIPITILAGL